MGGGLMRFVEGMRASEFLLVVGESLLLLRRQDAEFLLLDIGDLISLYGGEVVVVLQPRKSAFFPEPPG